MVEVDGLFLFVSFIHFKAVIHHQDMDNSIAHSQNMQDAARGSGSQVTVPKTKVRRKITDLWSMYHKSNYIPKKYTANE